MTDEEKRQLNLENEERRRQIQAQLANVKTPPVYEVEVDPAVLEHKEDPNEKRLSPEERQRLFQTLSEGSLMPEASDAVPAPAPQQAQGGLSGALLGAVANNPALMEAIVKALPPDQQAKLVAGLLGQMQPQPATAPAPAPSLDSPNILQETLASRREREAETAVAEQTLDADTRKSVLEQVAGDEDTLGFLKQMGGFR